MNSFSEGDLNTVINSDLHFASLKQLYIINTFYRQNNVVLVATPGIDGKGDVTHKLKEYLPNALFIIFMIDVSRAGGLEYDRVYT